MASLSIIRIGRNKVKATRQKIQKFKAILDKLKVPHILDDISFHNTFVDLNRMKLIHNTHVWKVERDGSLSLKNRFGHNGRFEYRHLDIPSLLEFQFVNVSILSRDEAEFLSCLIDDVESISKLVTTEGS